MFKTKDHIEYNKKIYAFLLFFFFLHTFKLKTEVIIDSKPLLVAELNKFVVI